jgi:hypothetical protein
VSKPISHQLDIYGAWLHVATDRKAWRALRHKLPTLEKEPAAAGRVDLTIHTADSGRDTPHVSIWIDVSQATDQADLVDTIAHESAHAAGAVLDHVGQAYDANSEALAYLVGWIAGWLWRACAEA